MAMTAKELLARAGDLYDQSHQKQLNINVEDVGVFLMNVPTAQDLEDANVYYNAHKWECTNSDTVLVWRQIAEPNLRDAELCAALAQKAGRSDATPGPWVVEAIMKPGQIGRIAGVFMDKLGYKLDSARALTDDETKALESQVVAAEAAKHGEQVKN